MFTTGEDWQVQFHYKDSAGGAVAENAIGIHAATAVTAAALNTAVQAAWTAAQLDWMASTGTLVSIAYKDLAGVIATQEFNTDGTAKWNGGGTGQSIPQCAGILKLQTGLAGRSHRGRIFIPFLGEGEQDGGTVIDALATATAWATFANTLAALSPSLVVSIVSRKLSTLTPVTTYQGELISGTQRRRVARLR